MNFSTSFVTMTAARIIAALMILFWCIFKLAVSGFEPMNMVESLICVLVLGTTVIAWKWRGIGGMLFIGLAIFYVLLTWPDYSTITYAIAVIPMIFSGTLFIISRYTP